MERNHRLYTPDVEAEVVVYYAVNKLPDSVKINYDAGARLKNTKPFCLY